MPSKNYKVVDFTSVHVLEKLNLKSSETTCTFFNNGVCVIFQLELLLSHCSCCLWDQTLNYRFKKMVSWIEWLAAQKNKLKKKKPCLFFFYFLISLLSHFSVDCVFAAVTALLALLVLHYKHFPWSITISWTSAFEGGKKKRRRGLKDFDWQSVIFCGDRRIWTIFFLWLLLLQVLVHQT